MDLADDMWMMSGVFGPPGPERPVGSAKHLSSKKPLNREGEEAPGREALGLGRSWEKGKRQGGPKKIKKKTALNGRGFGVLSTYHRAALLGGFTLPGQCRGLSQGSFRAPMYMVSGSRQFRVSDHVGALCTHHAPANSQP